MIEEICRVDDVDDFYWELGVLLNWLGLSEESPEELVSKSECAPSLIARSDAQILNISSPRFAARAVTPEGNTIFNFRRLVKIREGLESQEGYVIRAEHPGRRLDSPDREPRNVVVAPIANQSLGNLLDDSYELADALFQLPPRFSDRFRVLSASLGCCYGQDAYGDLENNDGVPYVRMLHISGVCTQSVLFLASLFLEEHATQIHGVAEISARCRVPDLHEFSVGEVGDDQISSYCSQIGLRGTKQMVSREFSKDQKIDHFAKWMRSYLHSNMPISVPVNMGRFLGIGEIVSEGYGRDSLWAPLSEVSEDIIFEQEGAFGGDLARGLGDNHQVLVVGYELDPSGNEEFLIHDPASFPFLRVRALDLAEAAIYTNEERTEIQEPTFFSYTPESVKLPLANYRLVGGERARQIGYGLAYLSNRVREGRQNYSSLFPWLEMKDELRHDISDGEYFLMRREEIVPFLRDGDQIEDYILTRILADKKISSEASALKWVWVQLADNEVWIWNAEREYFGNLDNILEIRRTMLIAVAGCDKEGKVFTDYPVITSPVPLISSTFSAPPPPANVNEDPEMGVGIITSVSGRGLSDSMQMLPSECQSIDLYAFMLGDFPLFGINPAIRPHTIAEAMIYAANKPEVLERCVENIAKTLRANKKSEIRINALASFAPEIVHLGDSRYSLEDSVSILVFLRRLAKGISESSEIVGEVKCVEIVAGSRIRGLARASVTYPGRPEREELIASYNGWNLHMGRLHLVLREAIELTDDIDIPFALELEPGNLNFLNGPSSLLGAASHFSQDVQTSSQIGFNVDVPHWQMAGIELSGLHPEIYQRIVHFHVSDHHKGHFADLPFDTIDNPSQAERARWMNFIRKVSIEAPIRDSSRFPRFSKSLAVELEAGSAGQLETSFRNVVAALTNSGITVKL